MFFSLGPLIRLRWSLAEPEAPLCGQARWPASPSPPLVCTLLSELGLHTCMTMLFFNVKSEDSESGLHAHVAVISSEPVTPIFLLQKILSSVYSLPGHTELVASAPSGGRVCRGDHLRHDYPQHLSVLDVVLELSYSQGHMLCAPFCVYCIPFL